MTQDNHHEEFHEAQLASRLEWDNPEFSKADWGKGDWLNEPDKIQFIAEGYHAIILRSHHGAFCGYIGLDAKHPCYGLSIEGVSNLTMEVIRADYRDRLKDWGKRGRPKTSKGLPDFDPGPDWPEPDTEAGKALLRISVHGGLTYAGVGSIATHASWESLKANFEGARKEAATYPIGDAARWLSKWSLAEDSYIEFVRIIEQTCICLVPTTEPPQEIWWLGFDCAHAGDLCPAIEATLRNMKADRTASRGLQDVYRNLAYVEAECLNLAIQLRGIEDATP